MRTKSLRIMAYAAAILSTTGLHAAEVTLTAGDPAGSSSFILGTRWSDGAVPNAANTYYAGTTLRTPTATNAVYNFGGTMLTLGPGGTLAFKGTNTVYVTNLVLSGGIVGQWDTGGNQIGRLAGAITVASNSSFATAGSNVRNFWILSTISGASNLTFGGGPATGTTTLFGANNAFTGKMIVNAGVILAITNENSLGGNPGTADFVPDAVTLNAGALRLINASAVIDDSRRGITLGAAGGTISVASGLTLHLQTNNPITGAGGLVKQDTGTLILKAPNTYLGGTTISNGTLVAARPGALGPGTSVTILRGRLDSYMPSFNPGSLVSVASNAVLYVAASNALGGATLALDPGARVQFGTKDSVGATPFLVEAGRVLQLPAGPVWKDSDFLPVAADTASAGSLALTGNRVGDLDLSAYPGVSLGATGNFVFSGVLTQAGTAYRLGGGFYPAAQYNNTGLVVSNLTGARDVIVSTPGVVTLGKGNDYSGKTVISDGAWVGMDGADRFGQVPAAFEADNLTFDNGVLRTLNARGFTLGATRGITLGAGGGDFHMWGASTVRVDGIISGPGALTESDSGVLVLAGDNTFGGGVNLGRVNGGGGAGTVALAHDNALGTGTVTIYSGATLTSSDDSARTIANPLSVRNALTLGTVGGGGDLTFTGPVALNTAQRTFTVTSNATFTGQISDGGINKAGNGTLTLTGDNTITNVEWNAGHLAVGSGTALGTGRFNLNSAGGILRTVDGTAVTLPNWLIFSAGTANFGSAGTGDLAFNGDVNNGAADKILVISNNVTAFNGALTNTGTISKSGPGTLALNNNVRASALTNFAGRIVLGSGALLTNAQRIALATGSELDVSAVAGGFALTARTTLMGGGVVTGSVTALDGAQIQPGGNVAGGWGAAGTLAFSNNLTLAAGVTNRFDIRADTTAGSGINDLVVVAGDLDAQGATLSVTPMGRMTGGSTYRLVSFGGTLLSGFNGSVENAIGTTRFGLSLDESTPGEIHVRVSGSSALLTWTGGTPAWDLVNSFNFDNGGADQFANLDAVTFNDTAATREVQLAGDLYPADVTVDTAAGYTFGGTGRLAGGGSLFKDGAGILTVTNANIHTGQVVVRGGRLVLANDAALGAAGLGQLESGTVVSNGATLDLNSRRTGDELIVLAGTGDDGSGALVNNGTVQDSHIAHVRLSGDATIGAYRKIDFRNGSSRYLDLNGYTLTKSGPSNLLMVSTIMSNGHIVVDQGHFLIEGTTVSHGEGTITVNAGAMIAYAGHNGQPQVTWTNIMNGGRVGDYSSAGWSHNLASTMPTPFHLAADTEFYTPGGLLLRGGISGPGQLIKSGNGLMMLAGSNSYAGGTLITSGRLSTVMGTAAGLGTGPVEVRGNDFGQLWASNSVIPNAVTISGLGYTESAGRLGAIRLSAFGRIDGPVTLAGDSRISAHDSGTVGEVAGAISGGFNLELNITGGTASSGILVVSGDNSGLSGAVTFGAGTLRLGHDNALGTGVFQANGGRITTTGTLARTIANSITLNGNVTFGEASAITEVQGGRLAFTGPVNLNGAVRTLTADSDVEFGGQVSNGGITKAGVGTMTLGAANAFAGNVRILNGVLRIADAGALPSGAGAGYVSVEGLARLDVAGTAGMINGLHGAGIVTNTGLATTFTVGQGDGNGVFGGRLALGAGSTLVKTGAGMQGFTGDIGFDGATQVGQGILALHTATLAGPVNVAAGAILGIGATGLRGEYFGIAPANVNAENPNFYALEQLTALLYGQAPLHVAPSLAAGANFDFGTTGAAFPAPLNTGGANFFARWTGQILITNAGVHQFFTSSDDGSMLWIDGQLVVDNNRSQGVTERGGTIDLTAGLHDIVIGYFQGTGGYGMQARYTPPGGAKQLIPNALLFTTAGTLIGSLAGEAGSFLSLESASVLTVTQAANTIFAGSITGFGAFVKSGPALLNLTGANTYTGTTTVAAGDLRIDGTHTGGGLITVLTNATLSGGGSVGAVSVAAGGRVAPGGSPGLLTVTGGLTLAPSSVAEFELNGLAAGTLYDQIALGGSALEINTAELNVLLGFSPGPGSIFTIFTGLGGMPAGTFNGKPDGSQFTVGSTLFEIDYSETDITLTVVPEPLPAGFFGLLAVAALLRRRLQRPDPAG